MAKITKQQLADDFREREQELLQTIESRDKEIDRLQFRVDELATRHIKNTDELLSLLPEEAIGDGIFRLQDIDTKHARSPINTEDVVKRIAYGIGYLVAKANLDTKDKPTPTHKEIIPPIEL